MAEIKWIKLTTDMFDNRKIKHLRRLPDGNNIVLIWVMLLTMAGRCNANGMIFLTENIPYTPKMLADELDFEENTVQLALRSLEQLDMIITDNGFFSIAGWEEHQNIEGMDRIREQNRLRKQRQRESKKLLPPVSRDSHVTVTQCHATEEDKEGRFKKEDLKENISEETPIPEENIHGEFSNVILSSDELANLQTKFPTDWKDRIESLSTYMSSTGKTYQSHYATILNWARSDKKKDPPKKTAPRSYDLEAYERMTEKEMNPPETAGDNEEIRKRMEDLQKRIEANERTG